MRSGLKIVKKMDEFTKKHLDKWLEFTLPEELHEFVKPLMLQIVIDDPDRLTSGWPRVYQLIENQIPQSLIDNL